MIQPNKDNPSKPVHSGPRPFKHPLTIHPIVVPLKHRRYTERSPWKYDMTLCIAAACSDVFDPRVVVSFDWRVETATAGANTGFKFETLGSNWAALIAGPVNPARELTADYAAFFRSTELDSDILLDQLRMPIRQFRRKMADAYTHATVSLSYDEFLTHGETQLPEDLRRQIAFQISSQRLEVELILIGAIEHKLELFRCIDGDVERCEDFVVIGSGSTIAETALFQREHRRFSPLEETLYSVYEAQRLGQIAPGVGSGMTIAVINLAEGCLKWNVLNNSDKQHLARLFLRFGPRKLKGVTLPPNIAKREAAVLTTALDAPVV